MADKDHPAPDEILLWASGHLHGTSRYAEIEAHLAWCTRPCGEYLAISSGLIGSAMEANVETLEPPPATVTYPSPEELRRLREEAYGIVDGPAAEWGAKLDGAPHRGEATFLWALADRAVHHADERPREVLDGLDALLAVVREERGLAVPRAEALLGLAEGIAHRTLGEHLRALECFREAERCVAARAASHEYARICLARAGALRRLERFQEAEAQLLVAGQAFGRLGLADSEGVAKVYHQLANIAWQTGNPRRAFRMACKAARMFQADGQDQQARIALDPALSALIAMARPGPAGRLLAYLEAHAQGNPHWMARLLWKRGKLAGVRGEVDSAYADLRGAAKRLGQLGALLGAAQALLDLAHLAAARADFATQATAASAAAQVLTAIPGHPADLATAIERLRQALQAGIGLAEIVAQLRDRLQRR